MTIDDNARRIDAGGKHQPQYCWNVPEALRTPNERHCGDCELSEPKEAIDPDLFGHGGPPK